MFKKLIILSVALVVVVTSLPASALYIGFPNGCANPLLVDVDGESTSVRNEYWQGWLFARTWTGPQATTFVNPLADYAWEEPTAELTVYREWKTPEAEAGARNRSGGIAFVAGTGEFFAPTTADPLHGKGYGMNYIKLTLDHLQPLTEYKVYLWSTEARGVWSADPCNPNSKYVVWSTTNPKQWLDDNGWGEGGANTSEPNGGYGPINQPVDPETGHTNPDLCIPDSNMPCGLLHEALNGGGRTSLISETGNDPLGGVLNRTRVCLLTDSEGVGSIYGWADFTDWSGSAHIPLNGFMVVPEPATIALLGLGGLALIRRKRA